MGVKHQRIGQIIGQAGLPFIVGFLILSVGCHQSVDSVVIKPGTCPLPESLAAENQNKIKKFGLEISGLMASLAGGKFDADVRSKLQREYPDAGDVNRIYALSYAACVSCRLDPNDVKGCAQRFDDIIEKYTAEGIETGHPAKKYRSKLLKPLRGSK